MSIMPLAIVTLIYTWTSIDLFYRQQLGLGIVFISYAVANVGLMINIHAKGEWGEQC